MNIRKTIEFGGEPRQFEFGAAMFFLYETENNKPSGHLVGQLVTIVRLAQEAEENGVESLAGFDVRPIVDVCYYAMRAAAELDGEDFSDTKLRVAANLDLRTSALLPIFEGFWRGVPMEKKDEAGEAGEAKKKTTAKRSRIGTG